MLAWPDSIDRLGFHLAAALRGIGKVKVSRIEKAHPVDVHVGTRVRQRRKALHVSQQELAKRLGLTFQQVQKYERGMNRISASKLFEISLVLQIPVSWLFEGAREANGSSVAEPGDEIHVFLGTEAAIDLGEAFLAIKSRNQRNRVLDLLRVMGAGA